jgi:hypothetical protein
METALSTISVLPSEKLEVEQFKRMLKSEILADDKDPLKILVHLKFIEKVIADTLKDEDLEKHFLNEFVKYDKKEKVVISGAALTSREVGTKYFYDGCGDPVWDETDKKIKELSEKRKEREKFLQNIPVNSEFVDPDSGAYIKRPAKSSHTKVIVTL